MTQTVDPDFARRVAEYQLQQKKGLAFQAEGTVGGKRAKRARPAWRSNVMIRTLKVLCLVMLIKAVVFHAGRTIDFDSKAATVGSSALVVNAVRIIFYPDPISLEVHKWLTIAQQYLAIEVRKAL